MLFRSVIQEERKRSGFHVSDRIHLQWNGDSEVAKAFERSSAEIGQEVLAVSITREVSLALPQGEIDEDALAFVVSLERVVN